MLNSKKVVLLKDKCVSVSKSAVSRSMSIEEMREAAILNKRTKVSFDANTNKPYVRIAYGNEYVRVDDNSKDNAFVFDVELTAEQFEAQKDELLDIVETDIRNGEFDERLRVVSKKMSNARRLS